MLADFCKKRKGKTMKEKKLMTLAVILFAFGFMYGILVPEDRRKK